MLNEKFEAMKMLGGKANGKARGGGGGVKPAEVGSGGNILSSSGSDVNINNNNRSTKRSSNSSSFNPFLRHLQNWKSSAASGPASINVGSLISKELLKLDLDARNAIYEEIHGVRSLCPDESPPGMIDNALEELARELWALPSHHKSAYQQSQQLHSPTTPTYVNERDFRLRFLRAEFFDAKKAAWRLTQFLEVVLELFGPASLKRPVRLTDFSRKEMRVFNIGRIQLLPYRDRGGRRVVIGIPNQDHDKQEARTRVSF